MAPGTISPVSPSHDPSASDVDLTSQALGHKLDKINSNSHHANGHPTPLAGLDASRLIHTRTKTPRPVPTEAEACAGTETVCTDHMILCKWRAGTGWSEPELRPYGPLSLMPTASVLHYATECFEGLKAYRGHDGRLRLFRPDCNARRLVQSAERIALPGFDPAELERLLLALLAADGPRWLPRDRPGSYLYLRPALIGSSAQLGVHAPREAMLFVTASFMAPMDKPVGGMRLHTSPEDSTYNPIGEGTSLSSLLSSSGVPQDGRFVSYLISPE